MTQQNYRPEPPTIRDIFEGFAPATASIALIGTFSGIVRPFYPDNPFLGLGAGVLLTVVCIVLNLAFFIWLRKRRHEHRLSKTGWLIAIVLAVVLSGTAGYFSRSLGETIYNGFNDPVRIVEPTDGRHYYDQAIPLDVRYEITDTSGDLCDGHLWLMDDQPSGKQVDTDAHGRPQLEVLHIARQELPCREGKRVVHFTIEPWLTHTLAVYWLSDADESWALDNLHAWKNKNAKDDGRWVHLPDSAYAVSNIVALQRVDL